MICRGPLVGGTGWSCTSVAPPKTGRRITGALTQSAPMCLHPAPCRVSMNSWRWKKWQTSWVPQEIASALLILTRLVTENASSSYMGQTAQFVDTECQEAFLSTWYRLVYLSSSSKQSWPQTCGIFCPFPFLLAQTSSLWGQHQNKDVCFLSLTMALTL